MPPFDANVLAYICQIAVVACAAWGAASVCGIRAPRLLLPHYQGALVVGVVLPLLPTFHSVQPIAPSPLFSALGAARITEADWSALSQTLTIASVVVIAGCGLRLTWLVVGFIRLQSYRRAAHEFSLRMIACHELLHVARQDWLFVVAEELIRAAFWFHPAVWFLLDRIHLHREHGRR